MDLNQQQSNQNNQTGDYGSSQDYLKKVDHDADMEDIRNRLDTIEKRTKDKAAMVETLREVFEGDHNIDPVMKTYFESERVDLTKPVEAAVKKVDRDTFKFFLKKMGIGAWTLVVALISGGVVAVFLTALVFREK